MVECLPCKQEVVGSSPAGGSNMQVWCQWIEHARLPLWRGEFESLYLHKCGYSIMVSASACHAEDDSSILFTHSSISKYQSGSMAQSAKLLIRGFKSHLGVLYRGVV